MKKIIILIVTMLLIAGFIIYFTFNNDANNEVNYIHEYNEEVEIYVITDTHFISEELVEDSEIFAQVESSSGGLMLSKSELILDNFIELILEEKPDYLLVTGDITVNGEKISHEAFVKKMNKVENNGTAVFVLPGNHDLNNPHARMYVDNMQVKTDSLMTEDFNSLYSNFGYDLNEVISIDEHSHSYFTKLSDNTYLLGLDTNKYKYNYMLGFPDSSGEVQKETLEWMSEVLKEVEDERIIVAAHHNLLTHLNMFEDGFVVDNNDEVLSILEEYNVSLMLSGHIHAQDIIEENSFVEVVNGALTVFPHSYGIVKLNANEIEYESKLLEVNDPEITDFYSYSADFFDEALFSLDNDMFANYEEEEYQEIRNCFGTLNRNFFSGTQELNEDFINSGMCDTAFDIDLGFIGNYLEAILEDDSLEDLYYKREYN